VANPPPQGGWAEQELREAGAVCVYESIVALTADLDATALGGA
jgi:hypothetical protein